MTEVVLDGDQQKHHGAVRRQGREPEYDAGALAGMQAESEEFAAQGIRVHLLADRPAGGDRWLRTSATDEVLVCAAEASGMLTGPFGIREDLPTEPSPAEPAAWVDRSSSRYSRSSVTAGLMSAFCSCWR
ncbi:hypothetical protein [Kitasatospora sp. NPDC051914]|uniref:hypothetical protein n=1 Tax=Kitasatospora sp. NPDC051914 TaxID=3154945 RepID=UPI003442ED1B